MAYKKFPLSFAFVIKTKGFRREFPARVFFFIVDSLINYLYQCLYNNILLAFCFRHRRLRGGKEESKRTGKVFREIENHPEAFDEWKKFYFTREVFEFDEIVIISINRKFCSSSKQGLEVSDAPGNKLTFDESFCNLSTSKKKTEFFFLPVISSPAVRWEVGEPAKAIDPKVAPPRVPLNYIIQLCADEKWKYKTYKQHHPKLRERQGISMEVRWTTDRNNLCLSDLTLIWNREGEIFQCHEVLSLL